ncbi:tumor necrosis factor alpha-induced protein 2-like [Rhinoraja longicauda]
MKKFKSHLVGDKKAITQNNISPKTDCSGISPKLNVEKKYNRKWAIFPPFFHKKETTLISTDNITDTEEINEQYIKILSEKDIKGLIEQKQYFKADCHLIKLEYERYANDSMEINEDLIEEEKKGVESLYELLSVEIFTVAKNSMNISKENPNLLKMAVQVKTQEEKLDQMCLDEKGTFGDIAEVRPRRWEAKWLDTLEQSVNERLGELPNVSDVDKAKWPIECLVQHHKKLKEDFDTIVNCIKPCYPQEYNICEKYVEYYHNKSSSHMELIVESEPKGKEVYPILHWIYTCYPKLMNTITQSEETSQELSRTLLPESMISHLKSEYFSALQSDARMHMAKSLHIEEENWRSEEEPIVLNEHYHSELPIDIIQIIESAFQDTRTLTNEMSNRALDIMLEEAHSFLECFQRSAEDFEKSYFNKPNFISITILIMNCCEVIRNYIDTNEKITNAEIKEKVLSILNEMEKKRKDILLKTLFRNLKPHCKKLVTEKWFKSSDPIDKILELLEEHLTRLLKLKAPLYQNLLWDIHKQLITEYIIRIMKKRLYCKTENKQKSVADQIENEAVQLQKLFTFYQSEDTFPESALLKIAEIIRLKDIKAITVEVAALFQDFPDVRKQHIVAILYIKGNVKKTDEKEILNILNALLNDADTFMDMKLFTTSTVL